MVKFEEFTVNPIKTLDYEHKWERATELCAVPGEIDFNSWKAILNRHHEIIKAGIGNYSIYGLESYIKIQTEEDSKALCTAIKNFFTQKFSEQNILSIKMVKEDTNYLFGILIYPQKIRALSPDAWFAVENDQNGKFISFKYSNEMLSQLDETVCEMLLCESAFSENIGYKKNAGAESMAEVDLIKGNDYSGNYEYCARIYDAIGNEIQVNHDMSYSEFTRIVNSAIKAFTVGLEKAMYYQIQHGNISNEEYMAAVEKFIKKQASDISKDDLDSMLSYVFQAVFGNYILENLINADDISDIKVYSPNDIRVKCNGKRMTANVKFLDDDDYFRFFTTLATRYGINFQEKAINFRTDTTSNEKFILRINITTPEINSSIYPVLHIRKIPRKKLTMADLIRLGCASKHVMDYLQHKVNTSSIIFCGKGGCGKTTMMNMLIDMISWDHSGLVIQESEELFSTVHPDFAFEHIVQPEGTWEGYSMQDEARNGLRTDLDHFIIGEITGEEALYFLNAAMTGHKCMCSVHAPDTISALDKLADYVMYKGHYNKEQALYMLKEMKCIVYMENFKVKEISEITGWDEENHSLNFKLVYRL